VIVLARIVVRLHADLAGLVVLSLRRRRSVEAEDLFLRRELALYQERGVKPRRIDATTRVPLAVLSRLFDWRDALVVVRPETLVRWHRAGWRRFWRLRSRAGRPPGRPRGDQRWATFLRNHAGAIVAGDFFVLTVLKSPPHSPKANAVCERVIGTIRRECLDWLIPLSESHLRSIPRAWVGHYNHGRPHMALGPGVPDPPVVVARPTAQPTRHRIGERLGVRARSVLGGLRSASE
jgi:transposase InsO family protein